MHLIFPRAYLHLVWATYQRQPLILPSIESLVHEYLADQCRKLRVTPLAINGVSDHVHVLIDFPPALPIPRLVGQLKGASAHAINHGWLPDRSFRWQRGYSVFSVNPGSVPRVTRYIEQQKSHHARGGEGWPDQEPSRD